MRRSWMTAVMLCCLAGPVGMVAVGAEPTPAAPIVAVLPPGAPPTADFPLDCVCPTSAKPVAPTMYGDIIAILIGLLRDPGTGLPLPGGTLLVPAPIAVGRGAFKIAENESPLPQDRVFGSYNYYNNALSVAEVHREVIGFEKTFLDGNASFGFRLPFFQVRGDNGLDNSDIDDLTAVGKYALLRNPQTGDVLSAGLAATAPTGPSPAFALPGGTRVHPTLLQPFAGYLLNQDRWFVHGFSSLMVPTDARDVTVLFNDIGVGYWLLRGNGDRLLTGIVPTFEVHVNTPLNHREAGRYPHFRDSVDLTAGSTLILNERSSVGIGVGTTVTGPRLFDVEALVNFNLRF